MEEPVSPTGASPARFRIHSRTDVGKRRSRNEDSLGVALRHGVFVVADGMGGVDGGDYSSRKVVEMITARFSDVDPESIGYEEKLDLLEETLNNASEMIHMEAGRRGISGMGTTAVVLCFNLRTMREACVLHVGDSRVYRYRQRELMPVTTDHSLAAESGLSDSAMIPIFMAGVITRAVGVRDDVDVERTMVGVRRGDMFLLCSDGLYNMVRQPQMVSILQKQPLDPAAELTAAANDAGGFDNITVVLVEVLVGADPLKDPRLADTSQ